jgi:hypothetical protein
VIAINNTSESQKVQLSEEELAENSELKGLLTADLVRIDKDGNYTIIVDREESEVYSLKQKSGLNYPYLLALGTVYVLFLLFIYLVWKRGRKKKQS